MLSDLHVVLGGGRVVLDVQDVDGFLPLAGGDGRLNGFEGAAERKPERSENQSANFRGKNWRLSSSPGQFSSRSLGFQHEEAPPPHDS